MKRSELVARLLVFTAVLAAAAIPLWFRDRTALVHARMADNGGWSPDVLRARVGEPLHLQLTSDDVTHGFAVGQMDMQPVDLEPGKVKDVTLTFDRPGTYTFYCTRWCGIDHWRMRGTIEVSGDGPASAPAAPKPASRPLYVTLGIDIDAAHPAAAVPAAPPAASGGQMAASFLAMGAASDRYTGLDYYRSHSPARVFVDLRAEAGLRSLSDAEIWDLVAYLWESQAGKEGLAEGKQLFAQNCAACHGENGGGNGVFANSLAEAGQSAAQTMSGAPAMTMQRPADLTDPAKMLGASPALLEGKVLRGGMGTGMPAWGAVFREDQIWRIISYLYSFQFRGTPP